ncbi:MAG: hypothetical protein QOI66_3772 [Myxococcales bacterium]|jgi:hypothetical protein|nr:hypothetical protein [Myxococcales bacterium]
MRNPGWLSVVPCFLVLACGAVTPGASDGAADSGGGSGGNASGGATGSGGSGPGTGGASGSGGAVGSGGSSGSGGVQGSGGAGGSGGSNGSGGSMDAAADHPADTGGKTCQEIIAEYDAAFTEAKMCNPLALSPVAQCQATASASLPCGNCVTHVQSTKMLDEIRARWTAAGCKAGICPAIACINPGMGACTAKGNGGVCSDERQATTN